MNRLMPRWIHNMMMASLRGGAGHRGTSWLAAYPLDPFFLYTMVLLPVCYETTLLPLSVEVLGTTTPWISWNWNEVKQIFFLSFTPVRKAEQQKREQMVRKVAGFLWFRCGGEITRDPCCSLLWSLTICLPTSPLPVGRFFYLKNNRQRAASHNNERGNDTSSKRSETTLKRFRGEKKTEKETNEEKV